MIRRRHLKWAAGSAGALAILVVGLVLILTTTQLGRSYLTRLALERLARRINGDVTVDVVRGNLLTGATLVGLRITDPEGRLFLEADTVRLRYGVRALFRKRLEFSDVRFVSPVVLLDQRPGEPWNYQRIFPADTVLEPGDTVPGFGSWVNLTDVTVVDGTIELRREWTHPQGAHEGVPDPAELAWPESRYWIVLAPGGLQAVSLFHHVNAHLPRLRFAHPDTAARLVDIDEMRMLAVPFRPPAAHVLGGSGRVTLWEDTVAFENLEVDLPGTRLEVEGFYAFGEPNGTELRVSADPLLTKSLRWLRPSLPQGSGRLEVEIAQNEREMHAALSDLDLEVEGARVAGSARVSVVDEVFEIDESDVRFTGLDTRLLERTVEEVDVPIDGVLAGDLRLAGTPDDLDVEGWTTVTERSGATSRVEADGRVATRGGDFVASDLELRLSPLRLSLLRDVAPELPITGTLTGRATLDGPVAGTFRVDADLVHAGPGAGRSHVLAEGALRLREGLAADGLALRFDPLQAEVVRAFAPEFPLEGTLTGRAQLTGSAARGFEVDADVEHASRATGTSRVLADGVVAFAEGLEVRDLELRFEPLQAALIRVLSPDLPVEGLLLGTATLNGAPRGRLAARMDVRHEAPTGPSSIQGTAVVVSDARVERFQVDVAVSPLSLPTIGRFAPAAELRGAVAGRIALSGTPDAAALDLELDVVDGGSVEARGTVGVGEKAAYDLTATFAAFDASAVTTLAPTTALTGYAELVGVGIDPGSANARIEARLVDSALEGAPRLDSTVVRARLEGGLAVVDEGRLRLRSGAADVEGSFGLVAGRSGTLVYDVRVDSLSHFRDLLPDSFARPDSGVVPERPLPRQRGMARARADSARAAVDSLVASAATGRAPPRPLPLDSAPALPRDSISGSVRAQGVLEGSLERFSTRGTADLQDVVVRGSAVGSARLAFSLTDPRAPHGAFEVDFAGRQVRSQGFVFDSVDARVRHDGRLELGSGHVEVEAFQDPARDYALVADYTLAAPANALFLERMALRFDTTRWTSTQPGVIRWGGDAVQLEHIEVVNARGGRIFADGLLPDGGSGDLTLQVDSFQIANLAALLQDTTDTRGLLDLDVRVTGTLRAPRMEGEFALDGVSRAGARLPDVSGDFRYEGEELVGRAELRSGARRILSADARVPVNLALSGVAGPRLLDRPLRIDVAADSLPLEALPELTPALQDLSGRAFGNVVVQGTPSEPRLSGELRVAGASATVPEQGLTLTDGVASLSFDGARVVVDSLVATSGQGQIRVTGTVDVETLTNPVFDLDVTASDATLVRSERGDDVQADVALEVTGPLAELSVTGEILVEEGVIAVPEPENLRRATDLDDPALIGVYDALAVPPELRPGHSFLRNVDVDVAVRIQRDTWIRNSDLHVEIYTPELGTPLRVTSDSETGSLVLEGVVFTDRGEYSIAGRRVELTTGSITFVGLPEPDPLLQLNAQYEVPRPGRQALIILVNVGGYLSQPRVSLSSNAQPPLTESDLLSYLAFGRASSSLLSQSGSGIVGNALGSLGVLAEQQLAGLGLGALTDALFTTVERGGEDAGLDVFRVSAETLPDELNYSGYFENTLRSIELEAGEYLMRSRLFLATRLRASGSLPGLWGEYRTPRGLIWRVTWETTFLPTTPTLGIQTAGRTRVFGAFLLWNRRF